MVVHIILAVGLGQVERRRHTNGRRICVFGRAVDGRHRRQLDSWALRKVADRVHQRHYLLWDYNSQVAQKHGYVRLPARNQSSYSVDYVRAHVYQFNKPQHIDYTSSSTRHARHDEDIDCT